MLFRDVAEFEVLHGSLPWPWMAFAADGSHVAYGSSTRTIATATLRGERAAAGVVFPLPEDFAIPPSRSLSDAPAEDTAPRGLHAFSIDLAGTHLAAMATTDSGFVIATFDASGERTRTSAEAVAGPGHEARAIAFDRRGTRVWVSLESATETVIALLEAATLAVVGVLRSPAFPRPSLHEIHVHPSDDAILLLAACGEAGTFARVAGFAGDSLSPVSTELDGGIVSAGFVGFGMQGTRVHLAEADELRTHAWPGLHELSSVPFHDEFVSSFAGARVGAHLLVDGEHTADGEDAVMLFDRTAIRGVLLPDDPPKGMWAGVLGDGAIVTVEAKGDPARARLWVVEGSAKKLAN